MGAIPRENSVVICLQQAGRRKVSRWPADLFGSRSAVGMNQRLDPSCASDVDIKAGYPNEIQRRDDSDSAGACHRSHQAEPYRRNEARAVNQVVFGKIDSVRQHHVNQVEESEHSACSRRSAARRLVG